MITHHYGSYILNFCGSISNKNPDLLITSDNLNPLDSSNLIFLDSRGFNAKYDFTNSLSQFLGLKLHDFTLIVRPTDLTTFASLAFYLLHNQHSHVSILTNVGLVDFTPKNQSLE